MICEMKTYYCQLLITFGFDNSDAKSFVRIPQNILKLEFIPLRWYRSEPWVATNKNVVMKENEYNINREKNCLTKIVKLISAIPKVVHWFGSKSRKFQQTLHFKAYLIFSFFLIISRVLQ